MLVQLKALLRIDWTTEDTLLNALLESAADYAEKYLARSLLLQTRTIQLKAPLGRGLAFTRLKPPTIVLTYPPVESVEQVSVVDVNGNETSLSADDWWLDSVSEPPELHLKTASWTNLLRVQYVAGYGDDLTSAPSAIRRGILLHAAHLYKYRGDCEIQESAVQSGAIGVYRTYRIVRRG